MRAFVSFSLFFFFSSHGGYATVVGGALMRWRLLPTRVSFMPLCAPVSLHSLSRSLSTWTRVIILTGPSCVILPQQLGMRSFFFFAFRSWLAERHRLVIPSVGFLEHLQVLVTWARDLIKGSGPARTNSTIKWHGRGGQNNYVLSLSCFPVIQSSPRTFSSSSYYQCASHC